MSTSSCAFGRRSPEFGEDPDIETYVIAVKRDRKGSEPADWREQIRGAPGIQVLAIGVRLQVKASAEAIARLRSRWGDLLHIEKRIEHEAYNM